MDDAGNRIALVTGASRGIGRAAAVALGQAGFPVAVNYESHREEAEEVRREIEESGGRSLAVQADVSIREEVERLVKTIEGELGFVDVLVNNAGITRPQPVEQITEKDWDTVLDVNLKSVFLVTQAVLPSMRRAGWGRIINLSSVAAQIGGVVGPHYAASKAGILGMTRAYAALLAREGITVNAIAPALIDTDMVRDNPRARPDLIPVGRFGTVDEVSDVILMLAANGYITGQTINVNGGWYMN
ncbi:MAG: 3-oxoacyl-ACP reductase FabG [Acidobacteriota bacterium]